MYENFLYCITSFCWSNFHYYRWISCDVKYFCFDFFYILLEQFPLLYFLKKKTTFNCIRVILSMINNLKNNQLAGRQLAMFLSVYN